MTGSWKGTRPDMFTGIIEGMGTLAAMRPSAGGSQVTVAADFSLDGTGIGDSIAVNGACLTVTRLSGQRFTVDLSPETLATTTFARAKVGDLLNLERALRFSDRLDGHLVSGHVDGIGTIQARKPMGNAVLITISVPLALSRYLIPKGSVAVDGISLTVNRCGDDFFELSIIPHTAGLTTISRKPVGAPVNIETDMIGKYVERFLMGRQGKEKSEKPPGIDRAFLAEKGFL